jgi:hypothetical protein
MTPISCSSLIDLKSAPSHLVVLVPFDALRLLGGEELQVIGGGDGTCIPLRQVKVVPIEVEAHKGLAWVNMVSC